MTWEWEAMRVGVKCFLIAEWRRRRIIRSIDKAQRDFDGRSTRKIVDYDNR
jgi:hypothetical protein